MRSFCERKKGFRAFEHALFATYLVPGTFFVKAFAACAVCLAAFLDKVNWYQRSRALPLIGVVLPALHAAGGLVG